MNILQYVLYSSMAKPIKCVNDLDSKIKRFIIIMNKRDGISFSLHLFIYIGSLRSKIRIINIHITQVD